MGWMVVGPATAVDFVRPDGLKLRVNDVVGEALDVVARPDGLCALTGPARYDIQAAIEYLPSEDSRPPTSTPHRDE